MERKTDLSRLVLCIGIDPGKTGHIAFVSEDRKIIKLMGIPTAETFSKEGSKKKRTRAVDSSELFNQLHSEITSKAMSEYRIICFIEKAQTMSKQGIVSAFNYGVTYGRITAAVEQAGICSFEVHPATWKSRLGVSTKSKDKKEKKKASYNLACKVFPELQNELVSKRGKILHDKAEALLISVYGLGCMNVGFKYKNC